MLSRAVLDVRHGSEEEADAVLRWIERDRDEFDQVISLAGLDAGHAERFERAMRTALQTRFGRAPSAGYGVDPLEFESGRITSLASSSSSA